MPRKKPDVQMPKLFKVGNSVGFVIGASLLRNIDWRHGDFIRYSYDEYSDTLSVRNFSSESRKKR